MHVSVLLKVVFLCCLITNLDGKCWVALRACDNERCGECEDLVEIERNVKWCRERALIKGGTNVGRMTRLDSQDRARCGKVVLAHDVGGSSKVGADTNALEDRCSGNERFGIRYAEVVSTLLDWRNTGFLQGACQEGHVSGLICGYCLEVVVEFRVEAGLCEVGFGEVLETLTVELILEVL